MEQKQNDAQNTRLEDLEAPVHELTEEEAAQVDGGYIGSANGGVWKTTDGGAVVQKVRLSDVLISS